MAPAEKEISSVTTSKEDDKINSKEVTIEHPLTTGDLSEMTVIAEGEDRTTLFVWLLVFCCGISGLLFGYDTGVISGALVSINTDLDNKVLTTLEKEMITSATTLGALIGGLVSGALSDYTGRKYILGLGDIIFVGGAIGQALCHTVSAMIGGRFLIGLGVGLASCVAPLYIQELSPTRLRGRMVVINVIMITLGQVIAYAIGAGFESIHGGWRWMVGLGAVPAGLQVLFLFILPESPRVLLVGGKHGEAENVMRKIYAYATEEQVKLKVEVMYAAVQESIEVTKTTTLWQRIQSILLIPRHRRALIVACGLQAFQQICGFNTLMYYSATLFKSIGFNQPTAVGLIVAGTNFLFTLVALKYIDIIGRRKIILISASGMIIGLVLASVSFHFLTTSTGNILVDGSSYPKSWSGVVLASMIIFVASYATGLGNVPWQQGELFSLEVRGIGTSCSTAINWAANLLIGSTYLSLMDRITPSGAFGFYAGLCLLGLLFCIFCYPETAGLSLEEVCAIFDEGFGVRRSQRMRAEKAAMMRATKDDIPKEITCDDHVIEKV
ncbi:general substrate transporter [Pyrrhoderma noxium]|uniref:General substrate transporter n=1 Tax=Pyrrhoderma noxium TaxID=2282107 RepID=A0A286UEC8_9AGAM|nr:general substrate transporter [Pyrrhoderma noxium]